MTERVPHERVVVLTGPGGLGKTRLAAQTAQRLLGVFPDGVYFVGLAGIDADNVDNAIAEGLRVRREPGRPLLESLIGWLRDRRVLIVLDNCEQVIAAAHMSVETLSRQCPGVHVLATSRLPLGVPGELRIPLPPLDEASALDLFVDRLIVTTPAFDLEHDRGSLEQLCRRLDGFPLTLELAAARCRTLTPAQLLVRLEHRPALLHDVAGLFEERHRDLDRLIAWSLEELSSASYCVLKRLTVVIGSFSLETGEAVAAGDDSDDFDVVDALEELVDAGLIVERQGDGEFTAQSARTDPPARSRPARRNRRRSEAARRHGFWFARACPASRCRHRQDRGLGHWADLVERDLANFRQAHRLGDRGRLTSNGRWASSTVSAVVGQERGLMELADWCDATVRDGRQPDNHLEVAALAAAAGFWLFADQSQRDQRCCEETECPDRSPPTLSTTSPCENVPFLTALDPQRWPEAVEHLQQALDTYSSDHHHGRVLGSLCSCSGSGARRIGCYSDRRTSRQPGVLGLVRLLAWRALLHGR